MYQFGEFQEPGTRFVFPGNSAATGIGWSVWRKPRNINFIYFQVQGAGGGGMPGVVGGTNSAAGGGGGGSGAWANFIMPAAVIPETLFISVGRGGRGGVATTAAIATYVSVAPNITTNNLIMLCSGGSSPSASSNAVPGTAGAAGAKSAVGACPLIGLAVCRGPIAVVGDASIAGHIGGLGGTTGAAAALAYPTNGSVACGGLGGGGLATSNSAGGNGGTYTAVTGFVITSTGTVGPAAGTNTRGNFGATGVRGWNGLQYVTGGNGGTGQSLSNSPAAAGGGNGGNGIIGSGGGGGGGGFTGSTASFGGDGGDGLVTLTCW